MLRSNGSRGIYWNWGRRCREVSVNSGTPGCKRKDPKHPQRHGPYYQLSYTLRGKSSTVFVKPQDVAEVRRRIRRYGEFKQLCGALVEAYVVGIRQIGSLRRKTCKRSTSC